MLKKVIACVTSFALVVSSVVFYPAEKKTVQALVADPGASGWNVVWSDEFNGNSLDTGIWNYDIGTGSSGWGNNEIQYYTNRTDNVRVSDGTLKLIAKRENYGGSSFTSGRIKTQDKKTFKYGKMEAKIKVEGGNQNGVWPAFWMMGNDISAYGWPACGELDIMEHRNGEPEILGTLHWGANYNNHLWWGSENGGSFYRFQDNANNGMNGWHTYGVTWDETSIKWYVDDQVYQTAYLTEQNASYFRKNHFFLLNLALGGPNSPFTKGITVDGNFQQATMYVDYVRVYSYNGSGGSDLPSGFTNCGNGSWNDVGAWNYYLNSGEAAYKDGGSLSNFSMYIKSKSSWDWGIQAKPEVTLDANSKYTYSITANSSKNTGALLVNRDVNGNGVGTIINQGIVSGDNVFTGTIETGDSPEQLVFNLANIDSGTTFKITNFSISKVQETTAKPSDGYTAVDNNQVGAWTLYAANGSWTTGRMSYKGSGNNMDLKVRVDESGGQAGSWGLQMKYPVTGLDPNKTYDVKVRYNSSAAGTVLAKIEEGGTDIGNSNNIATVSGNNTYTTTASGYNQYQLVLELSGMPAGAELQMQEVSFTPRAEATTQTPTTAEPTSASTSGEWVLVNGNDQQGTNYYYNNATTVSVVNIQQPGFSTEKGIYVTVPAGISNVTLNGANVTSIQGAGVILPLSMMNEGQNTAVINYAGGTASIVIKKEVETTTAQPTTKEITTQEPTTQEPTTVEPTTEEPETVDPKTQVNVLGYQISATKEGYRVVGSVEPQINGKQVTSYGVVYAINNLYGTTPTNVTENDMVVGSKNPYVVSYQASNEAILGRHYGESETAINFAQVMKFGKKNVKAFETVYATRVYAVLEDGTYVYSDVKSSSVFAIAKKVYDGKLMGNLAAHEYLYNQILKVVDPAYEEVDYHWNSGMAKPGEL